MNTLTDLTVEDTPRPEGLLDILAVHGFKKKEIVAVQKEMLEFVEEFWRKQLFGTSVLANREFIKKHLGHPLWILTAAMVIIALLAAAKYYLSLFTASGSLMMLGMTVGLVGVLCFCLLFYGQCIRYANACWQKIRLDNYLEGGYGPEIPKEDLARISALQNDLFRAQPASSVVLFCYDTDPHVAVEGEAGEFIFFYHFN